MLLHNVHTDCNEVAIMGSYNAHTRAYNRSNAARRDAPQRAACVFSAACLKFCTESQESRITCITYTAVYQAESNKWKTFEAVIFSERLTDHRCTVVVAARRQVG